MGEETNENLEIWSGENQDDGLIHKASGGLEDIGAAQDDDSIENRLSEDSESDFEVKIRCLLHTGQTEGISQGARRSLL